MNINKSIERFLSQKELNDSLFFPRTYMIDNPYVVNCVTATLYCKYFEIDNPHKIIVFFYGNGECVNDYQALFPNFFNHINCSLLLVEYRGYGMSSGIPTLPLIMQDVNYIINKINVPLDKIVLYGRSLGFYPLIEGIKKFPNVSGIILDSCNAYPEEFIARHFSSLSPEKKKEISDFFNIRTVLESFQGKALVLHSQKDALSPVEGAFLFKLYLEKKCKLVIYENGGHSSIIAQNTLAYFREIKNFLTCF